MMKSVELEAYDDALRNLAKARTCYLRVKDPASEERLTILERLTM